MRFFFTFSRRIFFSVTPQAHRGRERKSERKGQTGTIFGSLPFFRQGKLGSHLIRPALALQFVFVSTLLCAQTQRDRGKKVVMTGFVVYG